MARLVRFVVLALGVFFVVSGSSRVSLAQGAPPAPTGAAAASTDPDLSTPRRMFTFYLDATRDGDFERAAEALDLRRIPPGFRDIEGPRLARRLRYVLGRELRLDPFELSDEPDGEQSDGLGTDRLGEIELHGKNVPIKLARVPVEGGGPREWRFSATTVQAIPDLYYEYGPGWFGDSLPKWAHSQHFAQLAVWQWLGLGIMLLASISVALVLTGLVVHVAAHVAQRTKPRLDDLIVEHSRGPLRALVTLMVFNFLANALKLPLLLQSRLDTLVETLVIASVTWFIMRVVRVSSDALAERLTEQQKDVVLAQGKRSFVGVVRRLLNGLILFTAAALVLTQFEIVRRVGVSLLASAGILGVALGFAAQKVLGNLFAGLQVSIAKPIRIGDHVRIEKEFGFVEEIGLTFVVIKTWDGRRLVLPITQIVEKPVENWTRTSPHLVGSIQLYADYSVPVPLLRDRFLECVRSDPAWDGDVANFVVLETTERSLILRGIASAEADRVFDMRCRLREQLIVFLQELEGGRYLTRARVQLDEDRGAPISSRYPSYQAP